MPDQTNYIIKINLFSFCLFIVASRKCEATHVHELHFSRAVLLERVKAG